MICILLHLFRPKLGVSFRWEKSRGSVSLTMVLFVPELGILDIYFIKIPNMKFAGWNEHIVNL